MIKQATSVANMVLLLAHLALSDLFALEVSAQGLQWPIAWHRVVRCVVIQFDQMMEKLHVGFYLESIILQSVYSQSSLDVVNVYGYGKFG